MLRLVQAETLDEWLAALELQATVRLNLFYADRECNTGRPLSGDRPVPYRLRWRCARSSAMMVLLPQPLEEV